ncbi:hypothetical protein ACFVUS_04355 [Nocardia sp. NPDC058058]|uniref:hypothetical protein n=1 Tax=Nocardia sp. NPDC058058 TaxID=3346317 RepID=UPI0036DE2283
MSTDKEQAKQAAAQANTVTGSDARAAGSPDRPEHTGRSDDAQRGTPESLDPRRDPNSLGVQTPDSVAAQASDPRAAHAPEHAVHGQPNQNVEADQRLRAAAQQPSASTQRAHEGGQLQPNGGPGNGGPGANEAAQRQHNGGLVADGQPGTGQSAHGVDPNQLRGQWREVQTMFVDDPRDAVTRADKLVEGGIQALVDSFAQRRHALEQRWHEEKGSDTEELRQALRGYRDLFDQLITASAGGATNI